MPRRRNYCTRVYSNQPHAHLLEEGHRQVMNPSDGHKYIGQENSRIRGITMGCMVKSGRNRGRVIGRVPGRRVLEKAGESFTPTFQAEAETLIEDIIKQL